MALAISIIGFLGILLPIVWALWKRRIEPDAQQRQDDIDQRMAELRKKIKAARDIGDDSSADSYLRQLFKLNDEREALRDADSQGQRGDN